MIYTIGNTESYLAGLADGPLKKKGKTEDYQGGSVWQTYEEAAVYACNTRSVFGVLADWEKDTAPSDHGDWHDLLVDAEVVRLDGQDI
jgi:hypothetical protein